MTLRSENHQQDASALDALEVARKMQPGPQRIEALKQAGLLRYAADSHEVVFAKRAAHESSLAERHHNSKLLTIDCG
jgi:hypothetical protein